jgi:hypothetical protein
MKKLTFKKCEQLLDRFLDLVKELDQIVSIALFGSIARGDGREESDVDLIIIHKGERKLVEKAIIKAILNLRTFDEYIKLREEGFYLEFCPIPISIRRLKQHPWILLDVIDHGVILFDKGNILKDELQRMKEKMRRLGSKKILLPDGSWYWDLKPDLKPGEVFDL